MVVSFFDFWAGLSGLIAIIVSNAMAYLIGFNRVNIKKGYYGFNSLLVGLALGVYYQPGPEFFIVLAFASLLTLFPYTMVEGWSVNMQYTATSVARVLSAIGSS